MVVTAKRRAATTHGELTAVPDSGRGAAQSLADSLVRVLAFLICSFLMQADARAAVAQDPVRLSVSDVAPAVWGVVETPLEAGSHPGVILLHGSAGWQPMYAAIARALADSGFVTLALDYYAESGGAPIGSDEKLRKWGQWKETVRNAVEYLQALPSVSGGPVGLVGYSRGAFLAVSVASSLPGVKAVVDFFGGGGGGTDSLEHEVRGLPALLILHGEADDVVPVRFARGLRDAVLARGGEVEMQLYPGVGPAFNFPHAPTYSQAAASDSFRRTVAFLRRRLVTEGSGDRRSAGARHTREFGAQLCEVDRHACVSGTVADSLHRSSAASYTVKSGRHSAPRNGAMASRPPGLTAVAPLRAALQALTATGIPPSIDFTRGSLR